MINNRKSNNSFRFSSLKYQIINKALNIKIINDEEIIIRLNLKEKYTVEILKNI